MVIVDDLKSVLVGSGTHFVDADAGGFYQHGTVMSVQERIGSNVENGYSTGVNIYDVGV